MARPASCPTMRHALTLAIFVALGALTTIGVSWLLTLDLYQSKRPMRFAQAGQTTDGREIGLARRERFGAVSLAAAAPFGDFDMPEDQTVTLDRAVPAWARDELLSWAYSDPPPAQAPSAARAILATGWPWVSMWSSYDQQPSPGYWWFKSRDGFKLAPAPANPDYRALLSPSERVLPLRIALPGFAMSVLFWGGAWGVLLLGLGVTRRAIRRRRGLCPACAYDRRSLDPAAACPECGRGR